MICFSSLESHKLHGRSLMFVRFMLLDVRLGCCW